MKRVRSESPEDTHSVTSKLTKLKSRIFSALGKSDDIHIERNTSTKNNKSNGVGESTPLDTSFQNMSQGPITARQLQEYYRSLQLENSMLAGSINNSTENRDDDGPNQDSTHLEIEMEPKPETINNEIIVLDDDEDDESKRYSNTYNEIELPEALELSPYFHQPDPLERANLVQLKKMMEIEKYRRYRLSYLKEHTRHLKNKNGKSVKKDKISKLPKMPKLKDIPANRRNKAGTFGISLLDTVPDEIEKEEVKPIDDNLVKKLKFNDTKSEAANFDISSKPRSFKPIVVEEKKIEEVKPIVPVSAPTLKGSLKTEESADTKPSTGFSFGKSNTTSVKPVMLETVADKDAVSSSSFKFKKADVPSFSVPSTAMSTSTEKETESVVSKAPSMFGAKTEVSDEKKTGISFGAPVSKDSISVPKFSFGASSKPEEKKEEAKSSFNFGTSAPKESISVPKFDLGKVTDGVKPVETVEPSKPAFSFGSNAITDSKKRSIEDTDEEPKKPAFSFGAPAKKESLEIPKLNVTSEEKKDEPKKAFRFGSTSTPATGGFSLGAGSKTESKPTEPAKLSFGTTTSKNESASPAFSFGAHSSDVKKPATTFGGFGSVNKSTEDKEKPATAFSFGQSTTNKEPPKSEAPKPAFSFGTGTGGAPVASFGSTQEKPASNTFSFGSKPALPTNLTSTDSTPTPETKTKTATNGFGFNSTAGDEKKPEIGSTFNFGSAAGLKLPSFGALSPAVNTPGTSQSPAPVQPKAANGFSFGNTSKEPTPSAVFGNANPSIPTNKPAASGFSFGAGNTGFGASSSNPMGGAAATAVSTPAPAPNVSTAGNMFSFNSTAFPTLNQAKQQTQTMNSGSSFNFGGNTPGPTPAANSFGSGFGNPNNTMNNGFGSNTNNNSNNTGFGGMNNNANGGFGATNGNSVGMGFGGSNNANNNTNGGFGGNNNAVGGFGGVNNNGFNTNNNNNSGFSFGGSGASSNVNSRASTPNFNFTGAQGQNVDPSAVFGAAGGDLQNQGQIAGRRKAYPRTRRR